MTQCLFANVQETNFWANRRKIAQKRSSAILASLPLKNLARERDSLVAQFPLPQVQSPALTRALEQSVPKSFQTDYQEILSSLSPLHGSIRKISFPKTSSSRGPLILHIQDVHMNQDAQRNISKTVASLLGSSKIDLIALEGATEDIPLQRFADFPNRKAVEMTADYLLRENKISGPIHAALTHHGPLPRVLGIDDPFHYQANIKAFQDAAPQQEFMRDRLRSLQSTLDLQKETLYSPELLALDKQNKTYQNGKSSLGDYVQTLVKTAHSRSTPSIGAFLQALKIERTLDFQQVARERSLLIDRLSRALPDDATHVLLAQSLAYRSGQLRSAEFYMGFKETCQKNGVPLTNFPAMNEYIRYVLLSEGINAEDFINDMASLEKSTYQRLIRTPQEQTLATRSRQTVLTQKLVDFALTPSEWKEYKSLMAGETHSSQAPFESFYREAESRDKAMSVHLLDALSQQQKNSPPGPPPGQEMERPPLSQGVLIDPPTGSTVQKPKFVLLVTGGFHAEGMVHPFIEHGCTVISYVPKIEKVATQEGSSSLSIFMQEKTPLEKLLQGEKLFLSANPAKISMLKTLTPALVTMTVLFLGGDLAGVDPTVIYQTVGGIGLLTGLKFLKETLHAKLQIGKKSITLTTLYDREKIKELRETTDEHDSFLTRLMEYAPSPQLSNAAFVLFYFALFGVDSSLEILLVLAVGSEDRAAPASSPPLSNQLDNLINQTNDLQILESIDELFYLVEQLDRVHLDRKTMVQLKICGKAIQRDTLGNNRAFQFLQSLHFNDFVDTYFPEKDFMFRPVSKDLAAEAPSIFTKERRTNLKNKLQAAYRSAGPAIYLDPLVMGFEEGREEIKFTHLEDRLRAFPDNATGDVYAVLILATQDKGKFNEFLKSKNCLSPMTADFSAQDRSIYFEALSERALKCLGEIKTEEATRTLVTWLETLFKETNDSPPLSDPDDSILNPRIRLAKNGLGALKNNSTANDPPSVALVQKYSKHRSFLLQMDAIDILGHWKAEEAIDSIALFLRYDSLLVRHAANALSKFGDNEKALAAFNQFFSTPLNLVSIHENWKGDFFLVASHLRNASHPQQIKILMDLFENEQSRLWKSLTRETRDSWFFQHLEDYKAWVNSKNHFERAPVISRGNDQFIIQSSRGNRFPIIIYKVDSEETSNSLTQNNEQKAYQFFREILPSILGTYLTQRVSAASVRQWLKLEPSWEPFIQGALESFWVSPPDSFDLNAATVEKMRISPFADPRTVFDIDVGESFNPMSDGFIYKIALVSSDQGRTFHIFPRIQPNENDLPNLTKIAQTNPSSSDPLRGGQATGWIGVALVFATGIIVGTIKKIIGKLDSWTEVKNEAVSYTKKDQGRRAAEMENILSTVVLLVLGVGAIIYLSATYNVEGLARFLISLSILWPLTLLVSHADPKNYLKKWFDIEASFVKGFQLSYIILILEIANLSLLLAVHLMFPLFVEAIIVLFFLEYFFIRWVHNKINGIKSIRAPFLALLITLFLTFTSTFINETLYSGHLSPTPEKSQNLQKPKSDFFENLKKRAALKTLSRATNGLSPADIEDFLDKTGTAPFLVDGASRFHDAIPVLSLLASHSPSDLKKYLFENMGQTVSRNPRENLEYLSAWKSLAKIVNPKTNPHLKWLFFELINNLTENSEIQSTPSLEIAAEAIALIHSAVSSSEQWTIEALHDIGVSSGDRTLPLVSVITLMGQHLSPQKARELTENRTDLFSSIFETNPWDWANLLVIFEKVPKERLEETYQLLVLLHDLKFHFTSDFDNSIINILVNSLNSPSQTHTTSGGLNPIIQTLIDQSDFSDRFKRTLETTLSKQGINEQRSAARWISLLGKHWGKELEKGLQDNFKPEEWATQGNLLILTPERPDIEMGRPFSFKVSSIDLKMVHPDARPLFKNNPDFETQFAKATHTDPATNLIRVFLTEGRKGLLTAAYDFIQKDVTDIENGRKKQTQSFFELSLKDVKDETDHLRASLMSIASVLASENKELLNDEEFARIIHKIFRSSGFRAESLYKMDSHLIISDQLREIYYSNPRRFYNFMAHEMGHHILDAHVNIKKQTSATKSALEIIPDFCSATFSSKMRWGDSEFLSFVQEDVKRGMRHFSIAENEEHFIARTQILRIEKVAERGRVNWEKLLDIALGTLGQQDQRTMLESRPDSFPKFMETVLWKYGVPEEKLPAVVAPMRRERGRATSLRSLLFTESFGYWFAGDRGRIRAGEFYKRFAPFFEWARAVFTSFLFSGMIAWLIPPSFSWASLILGSWLYGNYFFESHFLSSDRRSPFTHSVTSVPKALSMALIYGLLMAGTPMLLGLIPGFDLGESAPKILSLLWSSAGFLHFLFDREDPRRVEGEKAARDLVIRLGTVPSALNTLFPSETPGLTEQLTGIPRFELTGLGDDSQTFLKILSTRLKSDDSFRAGFLDQTRSAIASGTLSPVQTDLLTAVIASATGTPIAHVHFLGKSSNELNEIDSLANRRTQGLGPKGSSSYRLALVVTAIDQQRYQTQLQILASKGVALFVTRTDSFASEESFVRLEDKIQPWLNDSPGILLATVGEGILITPANIRKLKPRLKEALSKALSFTESVLFYIRFIQSVASNA